LIRYETWVRIGLTVRSLANSATSSSDITLPFHWLEFFAKSAMAEALMSEARSKTVCRPPFVEMCAPMRSPCFSWKRKRGMDEGKTREAQNEIATSLVPSTESERDPPELSVTK
jgi:hypothetical protein